MLAEFLALDPLTGIYGIYKLTVMRFTLSKANKAILANQVIAHAYNPTVSIRLQVISEGVRYPYPHEYKCTECCQRPIPRMILDSAMPTIFMLLLLDPPSSPPCQRSFRPNDNDKLNVGYVRGNSYIDTSRMITGFDYRKDHGYHCRILLHFHRAVGISTSLYRLADLCAKFLESALAICVGVTA